MKIRRKLKKISTGRRDDLDLTRIVNKSKTLRKDFKKYLKAVIMLISDAYYLDKKRFMAVILTSGAGISMLGFSLGVLLKYVKHLESNTPLKYLGYSFYPRDSFFLGFISISSMALLILSAGLILYSRLKARDIQVDYNLTALSRTAEKYGWNPPDDIAWINDITLKSNIKTLYTTDSQRNAMTLRRIFEGYQHFLTSFGGLAVLLWLDAAATFYLILLILLSLVFYVKINKRASKTTRDYENLSGDSNRRARVLLENIASWPNPDYDIAVLRSITHENYLKNNNMLFFDRFVMKSQTEFLSYILTAAALGFLVLTLGYSAIEGKKSWASVVGYIIILQMVMKAFKTLSKVITDVTRVYPGLSRAYEFNKKSSQFASDEKADELNLVLSGDALTENTRKNMTIRKGEIIALTAPLMLSRYSIKYFEKVLSGGSSKGKKKISGLINSMSIAVPINPPPVPVTIKELMGIPSETDSAELRRAAGSNARIIEKAFPLDPNTLLTHKEINKLSKEALNSFSLISCSFSDKPVLLVDNTLITDEWLEENKIMLKKRILIICYTSLPEKQISRKAVIKTYIAAATDCSIVALGSFSMIKKRNNAVKNLLDEHTKQLISRSKKIVVMNEAVEDDDDD